MDIIKKFGLPATLAYAGARVGGEVVGKNAIAQIVGGIIGAGLGIFIATKF